MLREHWRIWEYEKAMLEQYCYIGEYGEYEKAMLEQYCSNIECYRGNDHDNNVSISERCVIRSIILFIALMKI